MVCVAWCGIGRQELKSKSNKILCFASTASLFPCECYVCSLFSGYANVNEIPPVTSNKICQAVKKIPPL